MKLNAVLKGIRPRAGLTAESVTAAKPQNGGRMGTNLTLADVRLERFAAPTGASVHDLRVGAWIDERGAITVRNLASSDDQCERCGNTLLEELKCEFHAERVGTNGAAEYPEGASVVVCFDEATCEQRSIAKDIWSDRFPAHICNPYHFFPDWGPCGSSGVSLMLDKWLPDEGRALALAGRAIGIWANDETVAEITPESVRWDRPAERHGARGEYVDMFASAGHGLALVAVALQRGTDWHPLTMGTAYPFAEKIGLYRRYPQTFWDQPIHDAVLATIAPVVLVGDEQCTPAPLLTNIAEAIQQAGCHLDRAMAADINRRFPTPTAEGVDWRVGLHKPPQQETVVDCEIPF